MNTISIKESLFLLKKELGLKSIEVDKSKLEEFLSSHDILYNFSSRNIKDLKILGVKIKHGE